MDIHEQIERAALWAGDSEVPKVSASAIERARRFVDMIAGGNLGVVPNYEGGLLLEWCDPSGRVLGNLDIFPAQDPEHLDAELWLNHD